VLPFAISSLIIHDLHPNVKHYFWNFGKIFLHGRTLSRANRDSQILSKNRLFSPNSHLLFPTYTILIPEREKTGPNTAGE